MKKSFQIANSQRLKPTRLFVVRSGLLGDTLVALPALMEIRRHWPKAQLTYIGESVPNRNYVNAADVLRGTGLADDFIFFSAGGWHLQGLLSLVRLAVQTVVRNPQLVIILEEPGRYSRKPLFFRCLGRLIWAPSGPRRIGWPMSDRLLAVLDGRNLAVQREASRFRAPKAAADAAMAWLAQYRQRIGSSKVIGVAPWSNMAAKRWPAARFRDTVAALIASYDVFPVVLGAREERSVGEDLVRAWGRGAVAAGELSVQECAGLLAGCALYLGNDTGTMHLAAAVGTPCVAIFSARDEPVKWHPQGAGHSVLRSDVPCAGCMLRDCTQHGLRCLTEITVDMAVAACRDHLTAT